jgi:hypothetical protein
MKFLFMLSGWMAGLSLGVMAQEVPLRETPQGKVFGTERFAVRFDAQNGWAGEVLCDGQVVVKAAETQQAFDIHADGKWVTGNGAKIQSLGVDRLAPDTVKSRMRIGDWSVDACVQLIPEAHMLRRWFEITWQGAADTKIKGFWFQGGVLPLGEGGSYFYPAQYPPRRTAAKELVANRKTSSGRSPYPVIGETGSGWSAVWVTDELPDYSDRGSVSVTEGAGQIRITQSFNMQGHMRKGVAQKVGDAWLWVQPNDSETALRRMGEWFRLVKQVPPEGRPDWLKRVILYSFHPGGTIGSNCKDLGGFQAATEVLPHIRELGCNAIWLMPLEDKSIYWPRDYYKFQEGLGTADDYKALTKKAHGLGMRVWQDCVPHGGCNEFPRAREHPEWLAQNEDGSTLHYWCFDFNWPTWIDYMSQVVSFYTREYGLDGFRIDACGGSYIPNWNPAIPYARASLSQAQGGFAMQRALRKAVKAVRPDGANLAEVGASVHGAVSDSTYDFELCYSVLHDFRRTPAAEFAPRLRRWLHEQSCAEVPDLVRMRHVESHDSLRSALWYGADAQRALVALISWIHGVPLVYHEMEDGHYDVYRRIFHVRNHVAELNSGTADYLSVTAPEGVFACLRTGPLPMKGSPAWSDDYAWDTAPKGSDRASIVLVNLNGKPARGAVSVPSAALPESLRGAAWARDLMTGGKVAVRQGQMEVSLPPFGYAVLRFSGKVLPEVAPVKQGKRLEAPASPGATISLKAASGTLLIDANTGLATGWKAGWKTLATRMDLALPKGLAEAAAPRCLTSTEDAVDVTYAFGNHTLKLRYAKSGRGVEVRAAWQGGVPQGAAVLFDVPSAQSWFASTAEGVFESPFRVRHPGFDGIVGSIYRLPQGSATVWDSRLHPFGLSEPSARVGAACDGRDVSFGFDPACLPASVQVQDRVGAAHGMKVVMAWRDEDHSVQGGGELVFTLEAGKASEPLAHAGTGDPRLTPVGGGWQFENAHYRAQVGRNGVLAGLWRNESGAWRRVANLTQLYTDKGFENEKKMSQEDDVEALVRIERAGSAVRMTFFGELRGFYRFDKMAHPIRFICGYTFDDAPAFRRTCAFNAESASSAPFAFLSQMMHAESVDRAVFADAAGDFLTGERGDGKARYAQTAKAADPKRLPTEVRLSDAAGERVRLGDLVWFGSKPANVFLHGGDFHIAWMDGPPDNSGAGQWSGVSMSVACGAAPAAARGALPLLQALANRVEPELLRDGGFEAEARGGLALLRSGLTFSPGGDARRLAWQLPTGAAVVSEGGSRCATAEGNGSEYRLIRQSLPPQAFPAGSKWRLSARLKGAGVEKGDQGWKTACLRWALQVGGRSEFATASLPFGDSDWREVAVEMTVPSGLRGITVEAGLNGNKGRVWIDDMKVTEIR